MPAAAVENFVSSLLHCAVEKAEETFHTGDFLLRHPGGKLIIS